MHTDPNSGNIDLGLNDGIIGGQASGHNGGHDMNQDLNTNDGIDGGEHFGGFKRQYGHMWLRDW